MLMKRFVLFFSIIAFMSCSTAYQQIAYISSPQMNLQDNGKYRYIEEDIVVDYNFWAQNGQVSFLITNNSDTDVYLDLTRSFLIVNGMTFDYYNNRTYSTNTSSSIVSSSAYGVSNTFAVANGLANALSSYYGGSGLTTALSTASGSRRTSAYSTRTTSSSTINKGVQYAEKEGVWIPAHSSRSICEFSLLEVPYRQCGLPRNPSRREDATLSFSAANTPFAFDNMLMLIVNGADRRLVNSFYIERITNILEEQTYDLEYDVNCEGRKTREMYRVYKFGAANRFYIKYDYTSRSESDRQKAGQTESQRRVSKRKSNRTFDDVY